MFKNLKVKIQQAKKGYSYLDLHDISYFFQTTFVKMIREFENTNYGSPDILFEEVDKFDVNWINEEYNNIMESIKKSGWFNSYTTEDIKEYSIYDHYIRWRLILRRIAYCLEQSSEDLCIETNQYSNEYFRQKFRKEFNCFDDLLEPCEDDPTKYKFKDNKVNKTLERKYRKRENEIEKYRTNMKDEAFNLLSKYFFHLWD